jgi:hypothetical protein
LHGGGLGWEGKPAAKFIEKIHGEEKGG